MIPRVEVLLANTWICNLRCTYCFVQENGIAAQNQVMSPEMASQVMDALDRNLPQVKEINLHFYGGEALTNLPAIEACVTHARNFPPGRFTFSITTNGTVLTPRAFELLQEGRFDVILSIDGPAEVHDACRVTRGGEPTHARVMQFLETLRRETDCNVMGSSVIHSGWSLAQASEYLRSLNVDRIKAQAIRAPEGAPYRLTDTETGAYLNDLEGVGRQVQAEIAAGQPIKDNRFISLILSLLLHVPRRSFCGAGKTTFGITPTGKILPCLLLDTADSSLGSVLEPGWVQAGLEWVEARQEPRRECLECPAFDLCGGGCPAMLAVCGESQCIFTRKESEIARAIYAHFEADPDQGIDPIIALTGISLEQE